MHYTVSLHDGRFRSGGGSALFAKQLAEARALQQQQQQQRRKAAAEQNGGASDTIGRSGQAAGGPAVQGTAEQRNGDHANGAAGEDVLCSAGRSGQVVRNCLSGEKLTDNNLQRKPSMVFLFLDAALRRALPECLREL